MRALGWVVGQNLVVERRYANGKGELLRPLAEELVRLRVEIIVTMGTAATLAAKNATTTTPIIIHAAGDPVRSGLVASPARPGGNITGYSIVAPELDAKRLALLRELLPGLQRVGVLELSTNPYYRTARKEFEQVCRSLGLQPIRILTPSIRREDPFRPNTVPHRRRTASPESPPARSRYSGGQRP